MNQRHGQLAALAAALLFGCSAPLISLFTADGSALSIAGLLYAGASLGLLLLRLAQPGKSQETPVQRADWPALGLLTLLGGVVAPVALVIGLAQLPAASSSLLLNLEAVFTLLIAVVVGGEHLGRRALLAALLTIAGAVVLSKGSLSGASWQGAGLIALATLAWGIDNNISQRLSLRDPLQIASIKAVGAGLPMLAGAGLLGHHFPASTGDRGVAGDRGAGVRPLDLAGSAGPEGSRCRAGSGDLRQCPLRGCAVRRTGVAGSPNGCPGRRRRPDGHRRSAPARGAAQPLASPRTAAARPSPSP
jgi:drug/metabolite transporter (DMT)-like permease